MASSIIAKFLLLILILTIETCRANTEITCYLCTNQWGATNCDPPTNTTDTCTGVTCAKHVLYKGEKQWTARTCIPTALESHCESGRHDDAWASVCYCNTELCNKATQVGPVSGVIVTTSAVGLVVVSTVSIFRDRVS